MPVIYQDNEPLPSALHRYYQANGLPLDGGLSDKWARYKIGSFNMIGFPNFDHRRKFIRYHDIHHIVNNIDTTSLGEGLIAAWELGSGCGPSWISWCMEPQALWWGILMAPKKTFALFLNGKRSRNLFHLGLDLVSFNKNVGDLRATLLPNPNHSPKPTLADRIAFAGCAVLGIFMIAIFTPIFLFFTLFGPMSDSGT